MEQKQIKRILRKQILISFFSIFKFVIVGVLLLYWGMNSEALGYVVLTIFLFIVTAMFLQSDKDKNMYLEIYKINLHNRKRALNLINSKIDYFEGMIGKRKNEKNYNSTVTQESMRVGSSRFAAKGNFSTTTRVYSEMKIENLDERSKRKVIKEINKKLQTLNKLQELFEAITKPKDIWDV